MLDRHSGIKNRNTRDKKVIRRADTAEERAQREVEKANAFRRREEKRSKKGNRLRAGTNWATKLIILKKYLKNPIAFVKLQLKKKPFQWAAKPLRPRLQRQRPLQRRKRRVAAKRQRVPSRVILATYRARMWNGRDSRRTPIEVQIRRDAERRRAQKCRRKGAKLESEGNEKANCYFWLSEINGKDSHQNWFNYFNKAFLYAWAVWWHLIKYKNY